MKIGVFSDTHDHLENIKKAVDLFISNKVAKIIHCGDYCAPFIVRAMESLKYQNMEILGVFGNNDGERDGLRKILGEILTIHGEFHELECDNHKIAVYHGTDNRILQNIIKSQSYDLILTGHTHQLKIEKNGRTLIVNPGETCGYLTKNATCAIVDLQTKILTPESVTIFNL